MTFVEIMESSGDARPKRKYYLAGLGTLYALVILLSAARFAGWPFEGWRGQLVDFHDFYIAAVLTADGHAERAYNFTDLITEQRRLFGAWGMMPWTYPPQFDLLVAPLSRLPIGAAYALFASLTLGAYALTIRRLAPGQLLQLFLLIAPAIVVTARCGQNGFLTGALIGATAIGLLQGRAWAGLPLGLMVIKPHLAVAFALHVLISRRYNVALVAAMVVAFTSLVATIAFGFDIWPAFFGAVKEAGGFLARGLYPHYRMVSGYAMARSLGFSSAVGAAVQLVFAAAGLVATALAVIRFNPRQAIGVAAIASVMISPYAYDYDLPVYGVGVAMLLGDLSRYGAPRERFALYVYVLCVQITAFVLAIRADWLGPLHPAPVSIACLTVVATLFTAWRILERARPQTILQGQTARAETCAI